MKKISDVIFALILTLATVFCTLFFAPSIFKADASVNIEEYNTQMDYGDPFYDKPHLEEYTSVFSFGYVETVTNDAVSFIYDSSTKILKIEGNGIVPNDHDFDNVEKIIIGEGITEISEAAFEDFTSLKEIVMPESLKIIGESAFSNCIALYEISFPDSVEIIGNRAFMGCLNLKKINLGSGIRNIGYQAFHETNYYLNEDNWKDGELYLDGCLLEAKQFYDGDYIIKDGTRLIGGYVFFGNWEIDSFSIPDSVIAISDGAFINCKINANDIPESVEYIGVLAFATTPDLHKMNSNVVISENVKSIGAGAFYNRDVTAFSVDKNNPYFSRDEEGAIFSKNMKKLVAFPDGSPITSYTIPDGVSEIGDFAFACCDFQNISIPESVKKLGYGAFSLCRQLSEFIITDTVNELGNYVFHSSEIERFDTGDRLVDIGSFGNTKAEYVRIGKSINYIGLSFTDVIEYEVDSENQYYCNDEYGVLYNKSKTELVSFPSCTPVEHYVIPSSVKMVGGCTDPFSNLKTLTFPENFKPDRDYLIWEQILGYPKNTVVNIAAEKYIIPEGNEYFCSDENGVIFSKDKTVLVAYPRMNKSTHYTVPEGVETIAWLAFQNCDNLTEIHISPDVKTIGMFAFNCKNLVSVKGCEGLERIDGGAFGNCDYVREITLPDKPMRLMGEIFSEATTVFFVDESLLFEEVDGCWYFGNHFIDLCFSEQGENVSLREGTLDINGGISPSVMNMYIPKSVKLINTVAFTEAEGLQNIYYAGTPKEWEEIEIFNIEAIDGFLNGNEILDNAVIHYNSTGIPAPEPRPETVTDKNTDVSIEFDASRYNGDVEFFIEPDIDDGSAFDLITTETDVEDFFLYDITMNFNGMSIQPAGYVTVKIPLPENFDPSRSFIYHIDTEKGHLERMNARFEDGYMIFETNHFSYYAIVEETADFTIRFNHADKTLIYKQSDSVSATASEGKVIYTSSDPDVVSVDENGNITAKKEGTAVIAATVEGTEFSATCNITVKYAWWQWIIRILLLGFIWY